MSLEVCGKCWDVICDGYCHVCGEPVRLLPLADEYIRLRNLSKKRKAMIRALIANYGDLVEAFATIDSNAITCALNAVLPILDEAKELEADDGKDG